MDISWSHDFDHNLWLLISQTRQAMHKLRKKDLAPYNISPIEAGVLAIVNTISKDKATPANISRLLLREPNAVSQLLSRMEKKGLIRKNSDLKKKNLIRIELTKKGLEKYQQAKNRENISEVMAALSIEERQRLGAYLQILKITSLKRLDIKVADF